jgi:hypothetical protein
MGAERTGEHRPVQARDGVHTQLGHHAGEQDADRDRRDRVRIGRPEVHGHGGGLGEEADEQQRHGHDDESVGSVTVERCADLGQVERAGARIEQRDPDEDRVGRHAVGDGEVDRALDRPALFDPVRGQRVRHRTHQLEEHDEVEQVAGQAERDHRCEEHEHQRVEQPVRAVEIAPRVDERGGDERGGERGQPGADRIDRERDPDRHHVARAPATHPVGERMIRRANEQDRAQRDHRDGDAAGHDVVD